ncbi:MAG TPA: hypothetical protein ENK79_02535 [Campylobacterales bacterium]|nr:hypothetical protein [Campylobacterales bacterium]
MKLKKITLLTLIYLLNGCGNHSTNSYIKSLENDNNISYEKIKNSRGIYITSMCYTKTKDENSNQISNPCYACHINGKEPNYINDSSLQLEYNFPKEIMKNPFANLFKDRTKAVEAISDSEILEYVQKSNYFDRKGEIVLASSLPDDWRGYRPDCYYNFDDEGFDRDPKGSYTLWRAFRYYPFLGTFWPTNGSTDDVLIRLDKAFSEDNSSDFDKEIYKLNLAIVEAVVKGKDVNLSKAVDESKYGVDLNQK